MLVERLSNIEILLQQQQDAMLFAECCKYGRLNNKILGHPFKITRLPTYNENSLNAKYQADPDTTMYIMGARISFKHGGCTCEETMPSALEAVAGKEYSEEVYSREDNTHPSEAGWVDSRFRFVEEEAIQRYIDSLFKDSPFTVTFFEDYTLSISSNTRREEISLSVLLEQIPKAVPALGHAGVACIESIEICAIAWSADEMIRTIQKATNLKEGALRDECIGKRDGYRRHALQMLRDMGFVSGINEVYDFLKSKGYRKFLFLLFGSSS